jgi:NTP pyrophosphatase (non-canonical NTP hydrolase)
MKSGFIDDEILFKAIETWGNDAQCEMIIEECMELALALQKAKRLRGGTREEKIKSIVDEIADVKIMIRQAEHLFPASMINERVDFKMKRLEERLIEKVI